MLASTASARTSSGGLGEQPQKHGMLCLRARVCLCVCVSVCLCVCVCVLCVALGPFVSAFLSVLVHVALVCLMFPGVADSLVRLFHVTRLAPLEGSKNDSLEQAWFVCAGRKQCARTCTCVCTCVCACVCVCPKSTRFKLLSPGLALLCRMHLKNECGFFHYLSHTIESKS